MSFVIFLLTLFYDANIITKKDKVCNYFRKIINSIIIFEWNSGLPYYVAVSDHHIMGYCYLHQWNNRCAYSSTKEVSVYLDKNARRQGIGTELLKEILKNINPENVHVLISGICLPNESSVRLHEKFGFKQVSLMKEIGRKFNEWRDVGHWQLVLEKWNPLISRQPFLPDGYKSPDGQVWQYCPLYYNNSQVSI